MPNLERLEKEARRWLGALQAGDDDARARLARAVPDAPIHPTLRDVQHALAREHGFAGWVELAAAVERQAAEISGAGATALALYEAKAQALLEAYRMGTPEAMERHYRYTWHRRAWRTMRTYVQLDLGKRPARPDDEVEITLEDARHLVALEHGFGHWRELEAFADALRPERRVTAKPLRVLARRGPKWRPIAASRDWEEILDLLAQHPSPGLSGEGQVTDDLLNDLSRRAPSLAVLGLSGCRQVTDDGMRHLTRLASLEDLDLSGTGITDAGMDILRALPRLRSLSLAGTRVTAAGIGALGHCHALERLDLGASAEAGDAALRVLAGKRALRHLQIALTDDGVPWLHELPVFTSWHGGAVELGLVGHPSLPNHLSLRGSVSDVGVRHLRRLDGLFSLAIEGGHEAMTAAGLEPLIELAHLAVLDVDARDDWMPYLAQMPHLRALAAQDTTAGDDGFAALSRSQSLEYIWGRRCHNLRTRGFQALATMPALRGLSVSCVNVGDDGLAALPAFPSLRELMPMDVPDAGYRHIGRCERLESIVLMYCRDTTDTATAHITGLRHLSSYFNSYTLITDRTPEMLSTMDSLERVTLDTCHGLTNAGVARLARLPKLRELHVSGRGVTPEVRSAFPPGIEVSWEA